MELGGAKIPSRRPSTLLVLAPAVLVMLTTLPLLDTTAGTTLPSEAPSSPPTSIISVHGASSPVIQNASWAVVRVTAPTNEAITVTMDGDWYPDPNATNVLVAINTLDPNDPTHVITGAYISHQVLTHEITVRSDLLGERMDLHHDPVPKVTGGPLGGGYRYPVEAGGEALIAHLTNAASSEITYELSGSGGTLNVTYGHESTFTTPHEFDTVTASAFIETQPVILGASETVDSGGIMMGQFYADPQMKPRPYTAQASWQGPNASGACTVPVDQSCLTWFLVAGNAGTYEFQLDWFAGAHYGDLWLITADVTVPE